MLSASFNKTFPFLKSNNALLQSFDLFIEEKLLFLLIKIIIQCILTVRHILVESNHFVQERKDIIGRRDVVESFRIHPTLIVLFLKQTEFYCKSQHVANC